MPEIVEEQVYENCVVQNREGVTLHNGWEGAGPVRRRVYDDGTIEVLHADTGELINRYRPEN